MRRTALLALTACLLTACAAGEPPRLESAPAEAIAASPEAVPGPAQPAEISPVRGEGPPLPATGAVLTRIAVGSGLEQTRDLPVLAAVAAARPELFIFMGDNVNASAPVGATGADAPPLAGLIQAYADLNLNAHFASFNMAIPALVVWNDQDDGSSQDPADPAAKARAERIFETYWGAAAVGGDHPGVYGSRIFGPPGRRVQILLLDTRFFRSAPNGAGGDAALLGAEQWRWLENQLQQPAELRLLVSSIPVLADEPRGAGWRTAPGERRRLYETIGRSGARGVVLLSGGGPAAGLHRRTGATPYPLHELTAPSLNRPATDAAATPANFGLVEIDWARRRISLSVRGLNGAVTGSRAVRFDELGI